MDHPGVLSGAQHGRGFRSVASEWLLAHDVLPGRDGGEDDRRVRVRRCGHGNRGDARQRESCIQVVSADRHAESGGSIPCLRSVATDQREHLDASRLHGPKMGQHPEAGADDDRSHGAIFHALPTPHVLGRRRHLVSLHCNRGPQRSRLRSRTMNRGDPSQAPASAISEGSASRPIELLFSICWRRSGLSVMTFSSNGVPVPPGRTMFVRMLSRPNSMPAVRVSPTAACGLDVDACVVDEEVQCRFHRRSR